MSIGNFQEISSWPNVSRDNPSKGRLGVRGAEGTKGARAGGEGRTGG